MTMKPFMKKIISLVMTCFCFISITACGEKECSHSYTSVTTKQATCKETGIKTYTCTLCGNTYMEDTAKLTTHSYTSEITKEATCKETGVKTYTCDICDDSYTEDIAKQSTHSYTSSVTKEPTDKSTGIKTYTCSVCGDSYTKTLPMLPILLLGESLIVNQRSGGSIVAGCSISMHSYILNDSFSSINFHIYTGTFGFNEISTSFRFVIKIYDEDNNVLTTKSYYTLELGPSESAYLDVDLLLSTPLTSGKTYRVVLAA